MITLKKLLIAVVMMVVVSCVYAQDVPPKPAQTSSGPVVVAQAPAPPAQTKTGYSQAEMEAAQASVNEANSRANAAIKRANALDQQLTELQQQYNRESSMSKGSGPKTVAHRQRASLLAIQISSLQARINRGESGGAAAKWAEPSVSQALELGNNGGMVGRKKNTTPKSKEWSREALTRQEAAALTIRHMEQVSKAEQRSNNYTRTKIGEHDTDAEAHKDLFQATTDARVNGDNAIWKWIRILAAGVVIALIIGLIGWFLPRQRREREYIEREVPGDEPLPRPEPQYQPEPPYQPQPNPEEGFYEEEIDLREEPDERSGNEIPTLPPPPPAPAPAVVETPRQQPPLRRPGSRRPRIRRP